MTGFGAAEGDLAGRRVRIEIRTVNHRWFNVSIRLPAEMAMLEGEVRDALRRDFARGHVSVSVRWTSSTRHAPVGHESRRRLRRLQKFRGHAG